MTEINYQDYPEREYIAGIRNYNSSCWLNSSLQALIACPTLSNLFLDNPFTIEHDRFVVKKKMDDLYLLLNQNLEESKCTVELMKSTWYIRASPESVSHIRYPFQLIASPELCFDFFSVFKTIYFSEGVVDIRSFIHTYFTRYLYAKNLNLLNQSLLNKFSFEGFNDSADCLQYLFTNFNFFSVFDFKFSNPYISDSKINLNLQQNLNADGMENFFILLQLGENPEYSSRNFLRKDMQQLLLNQEHQLIENLDDILFIKLEQNTRELNFLKPNPMITIKSKKYILCSVIVFVGVGHYRVVTRKYRADDNKIDLGTGPILDFCERGFDEIDDGKGKCPGYIYMYDNFDYYKHQQTDYLDFFKIVHPDWNIQNVLSLINLLKTKKGTEVLIMDDPEDPHFVNPFTNSPTSAYWKDIKLQLLQVFREENEEQIKINKIFEPKTYLQQQSHIPYDVSFVESTNLPVNINKLWDMYNVNRLIGIIKDAISETHINIAIDDLQFSLPPTDKYWKDIQKKLVVAHYDITQLLEPVQLEEHQQELMQQFPEQLHQQELQQQDDGSADFFKKRELEIEQKYGDILTTEEIINYLLDNYSENIPGNTHSEKKETVTRDYEKYLLQKQQHQQHQQQQLKQLQPLAAHLSVSKPKFIISSDDLNRTAPTTPYNYFNRFTIKEINNFFNTTFHAEDLDTKAYEIFSKGNRNRLIMESNEKFKQLMENFMQQPKQSQLQPTYLEDTVFGQFEPESAGTTENQYWVTNFHTKNKIIHIIGMNNINKVNFNLNKENFIADLTDGQNQLSPELKQRIFLEVTELFADEYSHSKQKYLKYKNKYLQLKRMEKK